MHDTRNIKIKTFEDINFQGPRINKSTIKFEKFITTEISKVKVFVIFFCMSIEN